MATAVATIHARLPQPAGMSITPSQWRVLTDAIFPSAKTPEAIALALDYCSARKLDPFKRAVHIVPMWNSSLRREVETVWPGINELQVTAARTGQWAGMDEPKWGPMGSRTFSGMVGKDDRQRKVEVTVDFPEWCAVTVYRIIGGQRHAFTEPVYWLECYARQGRTEVPNEIWQKRTRGQLHKNAKAASLRAAFPEEMGNDYTADEMEGQEIAAGGVVIDGHAEPAPPKDEVPEAPRQKTAPEWLKELDKEFANAKTADGVDAIVARQDVQDALDNWPKAGKDRLQGMIDAAIKRTASASASDEIDTTEWDAEEDTGGAPVEPTEPDMLEEMAQGVITELMHCHSANIGKYVAQKGYKDFVARLQAENRKDLMIKVRDAATQAATRESANV